MSQKADMNTKAATKTTAAKSPNRKTISKSKDPKPKVNSGNDLGAGERTAKTTNMPRNVNLYRHLIDGNATTEDDINFVLKLRGESTELADKLKNLQPHTYTFYGKTIKGGELKKDYNDVRANGNIRDVNHLINHRLGPTPSMGLVAFEISLRGTPKDPSLLERERKWTNVPKKERGEFPSFLPALKEEIKVRRTMKGPIKTVSAFEGYLTFPKYSDKLKTNKNVSEVRHLHKPGTEMSTLQWELSLR